MPTPKPPTSPIFIRIASWQHDRHALVAIRETVFITEQQVPEALEWDGEDDHAIHLLASDAEQNPIGTARLLTDGHIGRVAVLAEWRGQGVGTALMQRILHLARQSGYREVWLDAQLTALSFYEQLDFLPEGDIFMDAGIPHRRMRRSLHA